MRTTQMVAIGILAVMMMPIHVFAVNDNNE